ncbi:hypothetical protein KIN20_019462 [Parelaphostrongylus tenuis]|uniref:NADP-dependent oxidoreductase domain-containing protein n=1 Tax=Parelaphostrongylus tenuis TaxID=148309 RepID=A0AAD5QSF6_PARTN|nr:hypothetical protein KIN20_019462 [Parelaphostrongylus tenuis]
MSSLKKLRTTYLDLVLIHFPRGPIYGYRGIIKSIGVSNYEVCHLIELQIYAKYPPAVNQIEFHPYFTRPTLVKYCQRNGVFVQAFTSLLWGNKEILDEPNVLQLAKKFAVTPQTILYAFGLCSGVGIIPRSTKPARIRDNLVKVAAISLSDSEINSLNDLDRNAAFCPGCKPWKCL